MKQMSHVGVIFWTDCRAQSVLLEVSFFFFFAPVPRSDKQIQQIRSDRVPEDLWIEVCDIVEEAVIKTIPKKKKCKTAK